MWTLSWSVFPFVISLKCHRQRGSCPPPNPSVEPRTGLVCLYKCVQCACVCVYVRVLEGEEQRVSHLCCLPWDDLMSPRLVLVCACEGAGKRRWAYVGKERGEWVRVGRHLTPPNQFTGVRGIWVFIRRGESSPLLTAFTCSMNKLLPRGGNSRQRHTTPLRVQGTVWSCFTHSELGL